MGLLTWLKPAPPIDPKIRALVESAVCAVDPLLKTVPSHERKLAPVVEQAFAYCQRLALAIPGPIPITRSAFASEPLVHALFGSADDIADMLARSQCVRTHLVNLDGLSGGRCCALLGMRPREKTAFGARMTGTVLRVDEPQKVLYFTDHTLAEPSPDIETAHARLARVMFDGLIKGFVAHVEDVRAERKQLSNERALERAWGADPADHTRRLAALRDRLHDTVDALQPARLLDTLADYLAAPEDSLRLDPVKVTVDRAGVLVSSQDEIARADTLRFVELSTRDKRRWVVMIAHIDREEARAAVARLEDARRHIVI